ncbi:beta-lactamase regulator AmpE [Ferrimonas gelatinilytica]|uniref:Beta-lactamase regulator AmpE n=1 Tax=Ferrimonas gelatinilytica TaxID=1255257 RepID=A0ABP9SC25_9GAMM
MALFTLLFVLLMERTQLLGKRLQFERFMASYRRWMFDDRALKNPLKMLFVLLLPAVVVALLAKWLTGTLFGLPHLLLWIVVGLLVFGHRALRDRFRHYLMAANRNDSQACYHTLETLDHAASEAADSPQTLGVQMGQVAAWLNYRYYAAVALYFVAFGPAAALFYSTVRGYHDHFAREQIRRPLVVPLMHLLDWVPARLVALGFALSGHFSKAMAVLLPRLFDPLCPARQLITEVALAAEETPEPGEEDAPISVQPTVALLKLAKRNLVLLLVVVSVLTILGIVH